MDTAIPPTQRDGEDATMLRGLLQLGTVQRVHGEKLDAILQLLQPASAEQDGPTLDEMLQLIVGRLDAQLECLRLITREVDRQGVELPSEVAAAIAAAEAESGSVALPRGGRGRVG